MLLVIYVRLTRPSGGAALLPIPPLADIVGDYARRNGKNKGVYGFHTAHPPSLRRRGSGSILHVPADFVNSRGVDTAKAFTFIYARILLKQRIITQLALLQ